MDMTTETTKPKIVVICGPTGAGKTSMAVKLAQELEGEIISADSMQIYRYMNIGTAKPTAFEQSCVPHYLIDVVSPDETFDAARFAALARAEIENLVKRGRVPFVVGGAGLYIKALLYGLFDADSSNAAIRNQLKQIAREKGIDALYKRLVKYDPGSATRIHPNDSIRIIRALEIFEHTGKTISQYHEEHRFSGRPYDAFKIGVFMPRDILYKKIDARVDAMIAAGLLDEVKQLLEKGYTDELPSMQSIGYRHMTDFIKGRLSLEETVNTMKRDTRRYAKRQMTWFRADSEIQWVEPGREIEVKQMIAKFLMSGN